MTRPRPLLFAALASAVAALAVAPAASASTTQQSLMQDDDLVLYRGPEVQSSTLQRMAALGVIVFPIAAASRQTRSSVL